MIWHLARAGSGPGNADAILPPDSGLAWPADGTQIYNLHVTIGFDVDLSFLGMR
jgi:hypothetical protein